jgi:hypothetical protein
MMAMTTSSSMSVKPGRRRMRTSFWNKREERKDSLPR